MISRYSQFFDDQPVIPIFLCLPSDLGYARCQKHMDSVLWLASLWFSNVSTCIGSISPIMGTVTAAVIWCLSPWPIIGMLSLPSSSTVHDEARTVFIPVCSQLKTSSVEALLWANLTIRLRYFHFIHANSSSERLPLGFRWSLSLYKIYYLC